MYADDNGVKIARAWARAGAFSITVIAICMTVSSVYGKKEPPPTPMAIAKACVDSPAARDSAFCAAVLTAFKAIKE